MPPRFTPKLVTCLREGYTARRFAHDAAAGLTVAVIALPLAMALGIASIPPHVADELRAVHPWLSPPVLGLWTAVVAGFLISALGGSRVQIGGPTAAFVPIVYAIADKHGYEGLATATLMAGVLVLLMGVFGFGSLIKLIPHPVTTGFTAGIAVTLVAGQVKDFLGLTPATPVPAEFLPKVGLLASSLGTLDAPTALVGVGSLGVLLALRRFLPKVPGAIVAIVLASVAVALLGLDRASGGSVETIGSRFGDLPRVPPTPHAPALSLALVRDLIPEAATIAILCAIESLLSAVVADGMMGGRHRSDQELVAQGVANVGSVFFFGLPATGAIARTVANIKAGGTSPVAGVLHAVFLLLVLLALAPLARLIPLSALAAVLVLVAWNIAQIDHVRAFAHAPRPDVLVLLTTFGLTVLVDLTVGVGVGMVLASFLFMHRMAQVTSVTGVSAGREPEEGEAVDPADPSEIADLAIPPGVEVYEVDGPLFFGVTDRLLQTLAQLERPPRVLILRLRRAPHIDASGLFALEELAARCQRRGTTLLLGGVHAQPMMWFVRSGLDRRLGARNILGNLEEALARARALVQNPEIRKT